jgi:Fur family ferric uptake transcriptional regulator
MKGGQEEQMERSRDIVDVLKKQGYRLTPQRLMVVSAIENSEDHISAEEIYSKVVAMYPNVNISTVYRTLELLKRLGLVTETDLGGGRVRYHPANKGHHHHLICQECGAMIDLDESLLRPLEEALLLEHNFIADLRHLAIHGRCVKCRQ